MAHEDWRDPGAYEWTRSLDAFGFAWEFLRRNPEFVKELRFLKRKARRRPLSLTEKELFSLRWGVRFRGALRILQARRRCVDPLPDACRRCLHQRFRGLG